MAKPKSTIISKPIVVEQPVEVGNNKFDEHIKNTDIHINQDIRDNISFLRKDIDSHVNNDTIHITSIERVTWNNKETTEGAQSKANKVMNSLKNHTNDNTVHITKTEKDSFKDKYTRAETRNLLKQAISGLVFLESVNIKNELSIKYPNPKINSCVRVRSEKTTYIYNGNNWIDFNGLFTPEVTEEFDGLMTNLDKLKLDSIEEGANNYIHPDNVDVRHVSEAQIDFWNKKADNILASQINDGLISSTDKMKLDSIEEGANNYIHPEKHEASIIEQDENNRLVSDEEKSLWNNKAETKYVDSSIEKSLSEAKAFTNSRVASIFNSSEDQLQVLRSLAFELKKDDTVKKFFNLYNECVKNKEFQEHSMNDQIHMSRNDISLLRNVKSLLEEGVNPDWNETNTSSKRFIDNKPKSLPAAGGNADTVGGYRPETLLNNRSFYDYTIGTPNYTKEQVSVITEEDIVVDIIENLFNLLNKGYGLSILFKPGSYSVEKELIIKASNTTISGIGDISKLLGASIKIIGNNNTIENISIVNGKDTIVNRIAITVKGDNNIIKSNTIMNYDKGIIVDGSNNMIINNTLINIRNEAIKLISEDNSNYGNIVDKNNIRYSNIGIVLLSTNNSLTKNHITKNDILNCGSGIVLSSTINDYTKTTMNIINENIVTRGSGKGSEYLPNQKTIVSEFSSNNMISNNITSGKEIIAPRDVLSNNIF